MLPAITNTSNNVLLKLQSEVDLQQWIEIREQLFGTTVAQKLNQGTLPGLRGNQSRGPFLGTFLGKQKGTDNFIDYPKLNLAFSLTVL